MPQSQINVTPKSNLNLDRFLPYRLNRLAHNVGLSLSTIYTDAYGINRSQWRVMALLSQHQQLTAKQICAMTYMDKVKVSRAVSGLVTMGHLQTAADATDKRVVLLAHSAQGASLFAQMVPQVQAWEDDFLKKLTTKEVEQLAKIIDKLDPSSANAPLCR